MLFVDSGVKLREIKRESVIQVNTGDGKEEAGDEEPCPMATREIDPRTAVVVAVDLQMQAHLQPRARGRWLHFL